MLDRFELSGKVAIVTGAGQGLNRAMARALAEAGAKVAVADICAEGAASTADEIRSLGHTAQDLRVDVGSPTEVEGMVGRVVEAWGGVDVLVNGAGVTAKAPDQDMAGEDWERVIRVNLSGVFYCCKYVRPHMVASGKGGSIINIASISALVANRGVDNYGYCASKGGVVGLTRSLAVQWARHGIRVNAIAPGYFNTPMTAFLSSNTEYTHRSPFQRFGEPDELGGAVVFLASSNASYVTGTVLVVDGGYTAW